MIEIRDLHTAFDLAAPVLKNLQTAYERLPETRCQCEQPGECCAFLPEMTWIEALRWMDTLKKMPEPARGVMLQKFVEFYLTTPIRRGGCPFLLDGSCSIYDVRPFACRAYGLWSIKTGGRRTEENRRSRHHLLKLWEQYGVKVPAAQIEFEIDYCDKVYCHAEESVTDNQLMEILRQVYDLDQILPGLQKKFETEYHSDVSFLMASLTLGYRKAILGKFAVVKEIVQQGTDTRLRQMLKTVFWLEEFC